MNDIPSSTKDRMLLVDTDVHHSYHDKSDLYPYLTKYNAQRFEEYGLGVDSSYANNGGVIGRRADVLEGSKSVHTGAATRDVAGAREQLLDAYNIDIAILTGGIGPAASAIMDADYANALCRAFNDYSMEHWIAKDSRFRYALHVNAQDPQGAVEEIDRLGSHPAVCSVMLGCGSPRPFGHRQYHPIYEACVRHNLAVSMHFSNEGKGINPPPSAAGFPSYYIEGRQLRSSYYLVHVSSFIFEGVFEKFPTLRIGMLEAGFAWLAPAMWKMDLDWKGLRRQTPWVKKLPSEYIKQHMRFATQPMEEPDHPDALKHLIEWISGDRLLMFATDYPHWDWDDPTQTFAGYPDDMRRRVFAENAIETYNLTLPPVAKVA